MRQLLRRLWRDRLAVTGFGLLSGYFPRLDGPIMRVMDARMAIKKDLPRIDRPRSRIKLL